MLKIENVFKTFNAGTVNEKTALKGLNLELKEGDYTILTIDCAVLGIGNSSCGPGVLKKYSIDKTKKHRLHVNIQMK